MKLAILSLSAIVIAFPSLCFSQFKKKNEVVKVSGVLCGFQKSWMPIKKVAGKYVKNTKPTAAQRAACKKLVKPSSVSLAKLPSFTQLAKSNNASQRAIRLESISGVAPSLSEIVTSGPVPVFWRPDVVSSVASGSPTPEHCNEFFVGQSDGQSGGFLSCYMAQSAGYSLSEIVRAGTTLCYMKNMPTPEVARAGGFTVTSGTLPGGSVTTLFNTPTGSTARVVKIMMSGGGENGGASYGVLKIFAADQIAASGDIYRYEMAFCEGDTPTPQEKEKTRITAAGEFISASSHTSAGGSGRNSSVVRAFLRSTGSTLVFDNSLDRTASFVSTRDQQGGTATFKANITINGRDEIISKEHQIESDGARKAYSISRFTGTGMKSLRLFEGAIKQTHSFGDFSGATEYRDSYFAVAPSNEYMSQVNLVDITNDPFYSGQPTPDDQSLSVDCNTQPTITIAVDMSNDAMRSVASACEGERLEGVDFCRAPELEAAQAQFGQACRPASGQ